MTLKNDIPMNRTVIQKMTLAEAEEDYSDIDYWLSQPPAKRLEALELLRQIAYGYDPDTARLSGAMVNIDQPTPSAIRGRLGHARRLVGSRDLGSGRSGVRGRSRGNSKSSR